MLTGASQILPKVLYISSGNLLRLIYKTLATILYWRTSITDFRVFWGRGEICIPQFAVNLGGQIFQRFNTILKDVGILSELRSSHQRCSAKNVVLKNFANFTGKHLSLSKSMDWFLYDNRLCHERVNTSANGRLSIHWINEEQVH